MSEDPTGVRIKLEEKKSDIKEKYTIINSEKT